MITKQGFIILAPENNTLVQCFRESAFLAFLTQ